MQLNPYSRQNFLCHTSAWRRGRICGLHDLRFIVAPASCGFECDFLDGTVCPAAIVLDERPNCVAGKLRPSLWNEAPDAGQKPVYLRTTAKKDAAQDHSGDPIRMRQRISKAQRTAP